jgi:hypothetical protein
VLDRLDMAGRFVEPRLCCVFQRRADVTDGEIGMHFGEFVSPEATSASRGPRSPFG